VNVRVCDFICRTKDFYHTCYCLSGLSVAQHFADGKHTCTRVIGNSEINEVVGLFFNLAILLKFAGFIQIVESPRI